MCNTYGNEGGVCRVKRFVTGFRWHTRYELVLKVRSEQNRLNFTKATFFHPDCKRSCSHVISPLSVAIPPPFFFQLADRDSGPTQPSVRTTAEKRNHLVSQVSLALRKKTALQRSSLRWLCPWPLTSVLSASQLELALTVSQNFLAIRTLGKGRPLRANMIRSTEVNLEPSLFTFPKDLSIRFF